MRLLLFSFLMIYTATAWSTHLEIVVIEGRVWIFEKEKDSLTKNKGDFFTFSNPELQYLKIQKDSVIAAYIPNKNKIIKTFGSTDEQLTPKELEKILMESNPKSYIAILKNIFDYDISSYQGGKRLDETEIIEGMPVGTILKPIENLKIELDTELVKQSSNFGLHIKDQKDPIFFLQKITNPISIPASIFTYEKNYEWVLYIKNKPTKGSFSTAHKEDQDMFETELTETPGYRELSEDAKWMVRASKAKEWQYSYDMSIATKKILATMGD